MRKKLYAIRVLMPRAHRLQPLSSALRFEVFVVFASFSDTRDHWQEELSKYTLTNTFRCHLKSTVSIPNADKVSRPSK